MQVASTFADEYAVSHQLSARRNTLLRAAFDRFAIRQQLHLNVAAGGFGVIKAFSRQLSALSQSGSRVKLRTIMLAVGSNPGFGAFGSSVGAIRLSPPQSFGEERDKILQRQKRVPYARGTNLAQTTSPTRCAFATPVFSLPRTPGTPKKVGNLATTEDFGPFCQPVGN